MPNNQQNDRRVAVIAIGGNSLVKDKDHRTVEDQYQAAGETAYHIAQMIKSGWDVAIGHGNGPQVGFILRRSELARHELHEVRWMYAAPTPRGPSVTRCNRTCITIS